MRIEVYKAYRIRNFNILGRSEDIESQSSKINVLT